MRELSRLTEPSEPEVSLVAHTTLASSSSPQGDDFKKADVVDEGARNLLNDRSTSPEPTNEANDDAGQGHGVVEAALMAFKGEQRRAGRAHKVLRTTTAEQSSTRVSGLLTFIFTFENNARQLDKPHLVSSSLLLRAAGKPGQCKITFGRRTE